MKKIIAAFDGLKYSTSTQDYAIAIAKLTGAFLVGVFLDDIAYVTYKIYDLATSQGTLENNIKEASGRDMAKRDEAAKAFEKACSEAKLKYTVHRDYKTAIQELKLESVYADLLVIDSKETLSNHNETAPTRFIGDLLSDVQCPVLVVNQKYRPVENVVILYDGTPSSVHAIKMFDYLLPQIKNTDTRIVYVNSSSKPSNIPHIKLMKEFIKRHWTKAKYVITRGNAESKIISYLKTMPKDTLVILGAYQRGAISRWVKESMADTLMRELKLALFIAHNK